MAQQYDNTNTGVLFLNDRKEKDSHPTRKGSINVEGKEYWLSGWDKETSKGETISLSVQAKDSAKQAAPKAKAAAETAGRGRDEDEEFF
jgi:hypothetical protein